MVITVGINEDSHELILKKQSEIREKTGVKMKIADIVSKAVKSGIDYVNIDKDEEKNEWRLIYMRDINELHMFVDNYRYEVINRKLMYNSDRYVWRYDIICAAYIIVTKDFKIYIGSSNNFWRRLNKHIGMMKKGNYKIDNILRVYVLETKNPSSYNNGR